MLLVLPLIIPIAILGALAILIPLVSKVVVDVVGKKVPKRYKPVAAAALGVAVGVGAHYAGLPADQASQLAGLSGAGAVVAHETVEMIRGRRYRKVPQPAGPGDPK